MRLLYSSPLDDATITASSANSGYPEDNVLNVILANEWRSSTPSSVETLTFDAGAGNVLSCDTVFLAAHNFSTGSTITFEMNDSDSWGSPSVAATVTTRVGGVMGAYFTAASHRYARLKIEDESNADGYVRLGRIMAGEYLEIDPSSEYEHDIRLVCTDKVHRTPTGQVYSDEGITYYEYSYDFPYHSNTTKTSIETLYDTVGKRAGFFLANFNTSDWDIVAPDYVRLTSDVRMTRFGENWKYSIEMEGVS